MKEWQESMDYLYFSIMQEWQEYLDYHLSPEPVPAPSTSTPIPPLLYRDSR